MRRFWLVLLLSGVATGDDWDNVRKARRDRSYGMILRDGRCVIGQIAEADQGHLILEATGQPLVPGGPLPVVRNEAARAEVVLFSDSTFPNPHDALFSARSSWSDVDKARPSSPEWFDIL